MNRYEVLHIARQLLYYNTSQWNGTKTNFSSILNYDGKSLNGPQIFQGPSLAYQLSPPYATAFLNAEYHVLKRACEGHISSLAVPFFVSLICIYATGAKSQ